MGSENNFLYWPWSQPANILANKIQGPGMDDVF